MISTRLGFLGAAAALALMGCVSYNQTPNLELASRPAPQGLAEIDSQTTTLRLGPREMEVPITVTWTRVKDGDCLRVGAVKVERTGGSSKVHIVARIATGVIGKECATHMDQDAPPVHFDDARVLFSWQARRGIETFESSDFPVTLRGDGRATAIDQIAD